jgi:hypothetical protein
MQITRSSTEGGTTKGQAEWFTGDVYVDPSPPGLLRPGC